MSGQPPADEPGTATTKTAPLPRPLRTWGPMALWSAGILLALGLAWFVAAVVVPVWQTRAAVQHVYDKLAPWYGAGGFGVTAAREQELKAAVDKLGGPESTARRLGLYLMLPEWTDAGSRADTYFDMLDPGPRKEAFSVLSFCGPYGVPVLTHHLRDSNSSRRYEAAIALGHIGPEACQAVGQLIKCLSDPEVMPRLAAAMAIGKIGPAAHSAVPVLAGLTSSDADADVRERACESLGAIGDPRAVPALVKALADSEDRVRSTAAESLGRLGIKARKAVPTLAAALGDGNSQVRKAAAESLSSMSPGVKAAVPALSEALSDENAYVRWASAEALGREGTAAAEAVPALVKALKHEDFRTRWEAAQALGQIGEASGEAVPALIDLLQDYQCADDAATALGRIGHRAKPAIPALERCASQGDERLRSAAAEALKKIRGEEPKP